VQADRPDEVLLVTGRWRPWIASTTVSGRTISQPAFDTYLSAELAQAVSVLGATGAKVVIATEPYNRRGEQPDGSLYPEDDPSRVDKWNQLVAARARRSGRASRNST